MTKPRTGIIAALDIGSAKVTCFIARAGTESGIRVIGIGHHAAYGVRGGAIVDMDAAKNSILTAVNAAEEMAGEQIRSIIVNLTAGSPSSRTFGVEVAVAGHEIGETDLRRILGHGIAQDGTGDRELIHCIPVGYSIDGSRGIRDPRGMFGHKLGVRMHLVTAGSGAYRNLMTCVAGCHLDIEEVVVSPFASGLACLVEDEMDLGVTLVDMGGGTTTIAVFYDGQVVHADVVGIGGGHVTSDIARGLSTPLADAERMKTLYGGAIPSPEDEREVIDVPLVGEDKSAQPNHVPRSLLVGIIRPRLEETFELVRGRLEANGLDRLAGRRLVLTGGASQLRGVRELASLVIDKQVRLGRPLRLSGLAEATSGPAFATCAGLLRYAADRHGDHDGARRGMADPIGGRLGRIGHWFRESF